MPSVKVRPPLAKELKQIALNSRLGDAGYRSSMFKSKGESSIESNGSPTSDYKGQKRKQVDEHYVSTDSFNKAD